MTFVARVLSMLVVALLLSACERAAAPPAAAVVPVMPTAVAAAPTADEQLAITRLCSVLHALPSRRKQDCCGHVGNDLSDACVTALTQALPKDGLRIDTDRLAACETASSRALAGCNWVSPLLPGTPAACTSIVIGGLTAGARCGSSLACAAGHYCRGVGPGISGICELSAKVGDACETSNDNLAILLRAHDDPRHPVCAGLCLRGRCLPVADEGGQCASSAFCAAGLSCVGGQCSAQPLKLAGAHCDAAQPCAAGLICGEGVCAAAKAAGATCSLPFECQSLSCEKTPGADRGICADACAAPQLQLSGVPAI